MSTNVPEQDGSLGTPGCRLAVHGDGMPSHVLVHGVKGSEKLEGVQGTRSSRRTPGSGNQGSRTVHGEACRGHLACMGGTCRRSLPHHPDGHNSSSVHCTSECLQSRACPALAPPQSRDLQAWKGTVLGALHVRRRLGRRYLALQIDDRANAQCGGLFACVR